MVRKCHMTLKARKPLAAALELDRYDVKFAVVMSASRIWIDINTIYAFAMDHGHNLSLFVLTTWVKLTTSQPPQAGGDTFSIRFLLPLMTERLRNFRMITR